MSLTLSFKWVYHTLITVTFDRPWWPSGLCKVSDMNTLVVEVVDFIHYNLKLTLL